MNQRRGRQYAEFNMPGRLSRRALLRTGAAAALSAALPRAVRADEERRPAQIAITLDLEMSRNFPVWEDTHWDYEKGNLNQESKQYAAEAARRVKARGGRIHFFSVGRVCEQENVDWLRELAAEGHPIGNHTYDHVYVLAQKPSEIQFRFQRASWLIEGRTVAQVLDENIHLCTQALRQRAGVEVNGFRTPGGFIDGLAGREDIQQMLLGHGFRWVSSKYPRHWTDQVGFDAPASEEVFGRIVEAQRAAQPFVYPTGLIEIPMSPISDLGAFRAARWQLDSLLTAVERGVRWCLEHGAMYDFLGHPSCLYVTDPRFRVIDLICDLVEQSEGAGKLATLDEIAARVR